MSMQAASCLSLEIINSCLNCDAATHLECSLWSIPYGLRLNIFNIFVMLSTLLAACAVSLVLARSIRVTFLIADLVPRDNFNVYAVPLYHACGRDCHTATEIVRHGRTENSRALWMPYLPVLHDRN